MSAQGEATFGDALHAALKAAQYTQARLAKDLGIDAGQVSRWVHNKAHPNVAMVRRIGEHLGTDLSGAFSALPAEHELYVSAPITALDADHLAAHHAAVERVVGAAQEHVPSLYWPGEHIRGLADLSAPDLATERNMRALEHCSALLYLQFAEIVRPSGALIELGCALGRHVKTTAMIQKDLRRPFMLRNFEGVAATVKFLPKARIYEVDSVDEAYDLMARNGRRLLGLG